MSSPGASEPPDEVSFELEGAPRLLEALEDGRDALIDSGHLAVVVELEDQIRVLSRKLGFADPEGGPDDR